MTIDLLLLLNPTCKQCRPDCSNAQPASCHNLFSDVVVPLADFDEHDDELIETIGKIEAPVAWTLRV